ncbi:MAG: hypothetical protein QNM02_18540 [Acidimicrobiia bacterium]|jgi:hypothetical protein|nr:hypothetical protein [Acidimicrobiia bacterium]
MLRVSGQHLGRTPELGALSNSVPDPMTPAGPELLALTDAVVSADGDGAAQAAERLTEVLGEPSTVRAIAVAANFQMMNRMLDAIGVDYGGNEQIAAAIGVPFTTRE